MTLKRRNTQEEMFCETAYGLTAPFSNPTTSREAAKAIQPRLGALQQVVLTCLRTHPDGLTEREIENLLWRDGNTIRPRLVELRDRGLVKDSGKTRPSPSGRASIVWVAGREESPPRAET